MMWFLAWTFSSTGASAQPVDDPVDGEPVTALPPQRLPFGQLRTWSDRIQGDRIPVELQPLRELGNRALSPPRADRNAWQPRVTTALDADDNLLLSADDRRGGSALVLSPGVNWRQQGERHRIEIDASGELLQKLTGDYGGARLDAATVQASASARVSETGSLNYFGTLLRSHDPAGSTAVAPVPTGEPSRRFLTDYQRHEVDSGWTTGPRSNVSARWIGTWASAERPDFVRTQTHELDVDSHWQANPLLRLGVLLRGRSVDFAALPGTRDAAVQLQSESQWSPRLLAKAAIGPGWQSGGGRLALWRFGLTRTFDRGQWDLSLERDVTAPPGLGGLYEVRSVRLGTTWRVGQRASVEASLAAAEYRPLGIAGATGTVRTWRPRLSFTLPFDEKTWVNLRYQRIQDQALEAGLTRQGDKVLASILRTF